MRSLHFCTPLAALTIYWPLQKAAGKEQAYSREDVAEHSTRESRVWVTYKEGVYDVTGAPLGSSFRPLTYHA